MSGACGVEFIIELNSSYSFGSYLSSHDLKRSEELGRWINMSTAEVTGLSRFIYSSI